MTTRESRTDGLAAFAKEMIRASWEGCEGGDIIQEAAEKYGLVKRVPFDPAIHEDVDGYGYEAGDPWFVFTEILDEGTQP
jgi:hypothetical protein